MNDFLRDVIKNAGNEYAAIVDDGVEAGDVDSFIDTGSYIFNGLLSGSIYGGLPANKITAIAGESATGKTYFLMGISTLIQTLVSYTLKVKVRLPRTWWWTVELIRNAW